MVSSTNNDIVSRAAAVQAAVLRNQGECRYFCRQARTWVWPAARVWHAFTGWPQASVERPTKHAGVQAAIGNLLPCATGATLAAVGALCGRIQGNTCGWLNREAGEALGELVATPLYSIVDLAGISGAALLSLVSMLLDTAGAVLGTWVGMLTTPCVAYTAWVDSRHPPTQAAAG